MEDFYHSCDLLSFYYLCRTGNNARYRAARPSMLWFAFILLSLSYWKQLLANNTFINEGCDLLSFYYLCRTGNNNQSDYNAFIQVVICFHFTIFVVLETTATRLIKWIRRLWFAFILLSLSYWKQHNYVNGYHGGSCDLLSFYYLCRTGNNITGSNFTGVTVVICFHFTIFVVLETTFRSLSASVPWLWFAFILLSLSYWKQLGIYVFARRKVVICFHFTIFVVLETTSVANKSYGNTLWFAFILLSLSYWKQQQPKWLQRFHCCDLLSFYYLCRTGNNSSCRRSPTSGVVICFHFTIFVVIR